MFAAGTIPQMASQREDAAQDRSGRVGGHDTRAAAAAQHRKPKEGSVALPLLPWRPRATREPTRDCPPAVLALALPERRDDACVAT
jgi:hypothetical protein